MSSVNDIPKGWMETTLEKVASKIIDYRGKTPKKLGGDWDLNGNYRALSAKSVGIDAPPTQTMARDWSHFIP